jgi:nicotinamide mononucleotide transporter PnuC
MKIKKLLNYFSLFEWLLWSFSMLAVILSYCLSGEMNILSLIASMVGVTALIFIAKGNVIGQFLIILFAIIYAIISIQFRYWGEMITYLFMSLPASLFACISWLKNPSKESKNEVAVASLTKKKVFFCFLLALVATVIFYFILKYFHTAQLALSTISITTSVLASSFLFLRNRFYALAYAANDVVLIGLWVFASLKDLSSLPMVICFIAFLCNDLYGFFNWKRLEKKQNLIK